MLALSADQPSKLQASVEQHQLGYTLYSDKTMAAARAYGIAYKLDNVGVAKYMRFGIDLEAASGENHHQLPVPSVFVYNGGRMTFRHVNPDYKVRASSEAILEAARAAAQ